MRPRASSLGLAIHCVYPWTSGDPLPATDDSPTLRWGNAVHHVAEHGPEGVTDAVELYHLDADAAGELVLVAESLAEHVAMLTSEGRTLTRERRIAYDPAAGVSRYLAEDERPRPSEWHGRPDLFARVGNLLLVVDWKSGRSTMGRRPSDLPQIRAYAVMVAALPEMAGVEQVDVAIGQVVDGRVYLVLDTAPSLLVWEADLMAIAKALRQPPEPRPGPWCGLEYCPRRATCPTTLALARRADMAAASLPLSGPIESEGDALAMKSAIDRMRKLLDDRKEAVEEFAKSHPLPIGGGRYWGLRQRDGNRKLDAAKSLPVLVEHGLTDAIEHREPSVTIDAVEKLARQRKRGLAPKVIEALEAAGAVSRGAPYGVFEAFTPRKEA